MLMFCSLNILSGTFSILIISLVPEIDRAAFQTFHLMEKWLIIWSITAVSNIGAEGKPVKLLSAVVVVLVLSDALLRGQATTACDG